MPVSRATAASASVVGPGTGSARSNRAGSSAWQKYCVRNNSGRQATCAGRFDHSRHDPRGGAEGGPDAVVAPEEGDRFGCFRKKSQIRALAEMSFVLLPRSGTGGSRPGQVWPPPSTTYTTTSEPSLPGP